MGMKPALIVEDGEGGGGGPTEPPVIASEVACWWATDLVLANNDPVSSWTDRFASHAVTQTGGARPTYLAAGIGGKPSVDFETASSQYLRYAAADAISNALSGVVIAVAQFEAFVAGTNTVWGSGDEGASTRYLHGYAQGVTPDKIGISQRNADTVGTVVGDQAMSVGVPYILEWASTGTAYQFRINNVEQTEGVLSGSNNGDWFGDTTGRDGFEIGAVLRSTLLAPMDGQIPFVKVADAQLSDADRTALYDFLSDYYAITI